MLKVLSERSEANGPKTSRPENNQKVRVRFPPSPTGVPHIGSIRTALFNYLFAKNQGGDFILRIEDTDQNRLVPGSVDQIKQSLELLSLKWDEYYVQSERLEIYAQHLEILKEKGVVYEEEGAWRFKVPQGKTYFWQDGVHGKVEFKSDVIEDFIIIKSDKFPTYHFANVVDDHDMRISHVMRGDEWLPSTPKHLALYEAFGWEPPTFVHMPVIIGTDHKKLSKRDGAKSVMDFIAEGYLAETLVNFLVFLGWSPKDNRELFSLEELTKEFSLDRINKSNPIFNLEKLKWFNGQWIKKLDVDDLAQRLSKEFPEYDVEKIKEIVPLVNSRIFTLKDFKSIAGFFFEKPKEDQMASIPVSKSVLLAVAAVFGAVPETDWVADNLKSLVVALAEKEKIEPKDLYRGIGIAISGSMVTPPLFESLSKLGREESIDRLKNAAKKVNKIS